MEVDPGEMQVSLEPLEDRPAPVYKEYDLACALAILEEMGRLIPGSAEPCVVLGSLDPTGAVRQVRGVMATLERAHELGISLALVPLVNLKEAGLVEGVTSFGVQSLQEAVTFLSEPLPWEKRRKLPVAPCPLMSYRRRERKVRQRYREESRRAALRTPPRGSLERIAEIAAAGGHAVLLLGGGRMAQESARRAIWRLLPPPTLADRLHFTSVRSVCGLTPGGDPLEQERPMRVVNAGVSLSTLTGGGSFDFPGEFSLADGGVLVLEEVERFPKGARDALLRAMEEGEIGVSRIWGSFSLPAGFLAVGTGYTVTGDSTAQQRIFSHFPLMADLDQPGGEHGFAPGTFVRVRRAREASLKRNAHYPHTGKLADNAHLQVQDRRSWCQSDTRGSRWMASVFSRYPILAFQYQDILRVARTIADLEGRELILEQDFEEAASYAVTPGRLEMSYGQPQ